MLIKNLSIEMRLRNPNLIAVGLHLGTVKSKLSKPFSLANSCVSNNKIFTADYSVSKMINVLQNLTTGDSGKLFSWNGKK